MPFIFLKAEDDGKACGCMQRASQNQLIDSTVSTDYTQSLTYLASQDKTAGLKTSALDKNTSDDEIRPFLAEYFISEKHS